MNTFLWMNKMSETLTLRAFAERECLVHLDEEKFGKRLYDIFHILVDNYFFVVKICIEYLYDVTQILFTHAMKYIFFRKYVNMLLFCGNIRLMV